MKQQRLNPYLVIRDVIDLNRGDRTDWKKLFGCSLTAFAYKYFKIGENADSTYRFLSGHLMTKGILPSTHPKIYNNLKIGVSARWVEFNRK